MNDEIEQIEENKIAERRKQSELLHKKKKRSNSSCECENGPTRVPLTKLPGMTGEYCSECCQVMNWQLEAKEPKAKPEKEPKAKKEAKVKEISVPIPYDFPVVKILPLAKPDHMEFVCLNGEKMFSVTVPSTVEKVADAMKNPLLIVGKIATLKHDGIDPKTGFPINPVVTKVLPKQTESK
jgi:hypothetical protein